MHPLCGVYLQKRYEKRFGRITVQDHGNGQYICTWETMKATGSKPSISNWSKVEELVRDKTWVRALPAMCMLPEGV